MAHQWTSVRSLARPDLTLWPTTFHFQVGCCCSISKILFCLLERVRLNWSLVMGLFEDTRPPTLLTRKRCQGTQGNADNLGLGSWGGSPPACNNCKTTAADGQWLAPGGQFELGIFSFFFYNETRPFTPKSVNHVKILIVRFTHGRSTIFIFSFFPETKEESFFLSENKLTRVEARIVEATPAAFHGSRRRFRLPSAICNNNKTTIE